MKTAKGKATSRVANRRASPDVVEKRRVARLFNDVLAAKRAPLDGRTEKRRQRLLAELESGKHGSKILKPIDVLSHVNELLELGETLVSLRKRVKARRYLAPSPELSGVLGRLHKAYRFRLEAYRYLGASDALLQEAGIVSAPKRGRK